MNYCEWASTPWPLPRQPWTAEGCVKRDTEAILAALESCIRAFDWICKGQPINAFWMPYGRARQIVAGVKDYERRRRILETEAWYRDGYQKHVLAARRRLMRGIVLLILRRFVKRRAVALYWQERTQRALCAPGGAGRAADTVAFESEFA